MNFQPGGVSTNPQGYAFGAPQPYTSGLGVLAQMQLLKGFSGSSSGSYSSSSSDVSIVKYDDHFEKGWCQSNLQKSDGTKFTEEELKKNPPLGLKFKNAHVVVPIPSPEAMEATSKELIQTYLDTNASSASDDVRKDSGKAISMLLLQNYIKQCDYGNTKLAEPCLNDAAHAKYETINNTPLTMENPMLPMNFTYPLARAHAIVQRSNISEAIEEVVGNRLTNIEAQLQSNNNNNNPADGGSPLKRSTRNDEDGTLLEDDIKEAINAAKDMLDALNNLIANEHATPDEVENAQGNLETALKNLSKMAQSIGFQCLQSLSMASNTMKTYLKSVSGLVTAVLNADEAQFNETVGGFQDVYLGDGDEGGLFEDVNTTMEGFIDKMKELLEKLKEFGDLKTQYDDLGLDVTELVKEMTDLKTLGIMEGKITVEHIIKKLRENNEKTNEENNEAMEERIQKLEKKAEDAKLTVLFEKKKQRLYGTQLFVQDAMQEWRNLQSTAQSASQALHICEFLLPFAGEMKPPIDLQAARSNIDAHLARIQGKLGEWREIMGILDGMEPRDNFFSRAKYEEFQAKIIVEEKKFDALSVPESYIGEVHATKDSILTYESIIKGVIQRNAGLVVNQEQGVSDLVQDQFQHSESVGNNQDESGSGEGVGISNSGEENKESESPARKTFVQNYIDSTGGGTGEGVGISNSGEEKKDSGSDSDESGSSNNEDEYDSDSGKEEKQNSKNDQGGSTGVLRGLGNMFRGGQQKNSDFKLTRFTSGDYQKFAVDEDNLSAFSNSDLEDILFEVIKGTNPEEKITQLKRGVVNSKDLTLNLIDTGGVPFKDVNFWPEFQNAWDKLLPVAPAPETKYRLFLLFAVYEGIKVGETVYLSPYPSDDEYIKWTRATTSMDPVYRETQSNDKIEQRILSHMLDGRFKNIADVKNILKHKKISFNDPNKRNNKTVVNKGDWSIWSKYRRLKEILGDDQDVHYRLLLLLIWYEGIEAMVNGKRTALIRRFKPNLAGLSGFKLTDLFIWM